MDDNPISIIINPLLVIIMDYLPIKISLMMFLTMSCPSIITITVYFMLLTPTILHSRWVATQNLLLLMLTPRTPLEPRLTMPIMATPQPSSTIVQCGKPYLMVQYFSRVLTPSLTTGFLSIRCILTQSPLNFLLKPSLNSRRTVCHLMSCSSEIIRI